MQKQITIKKYILFALVIFLSPFTATAGSNFNYNYFEVDLETVDFEAIADNALGVRGIVSYEVAKNVRVLGAYRYAETTGDFFASNEFLLIGAGYHLPLGKKLDAVIDGGLAASWIEATGFEDSDSNFFLQGKLRFAVSKKVELDVAVRHFATFDGSTDLVFNALFEISKKFTLGALLEFADDPESTNIGVMARFTF